MSDPNLIWYIVIALVAIPIAIGAIGRIMFEVTKFLFSPTSVMLFLVFLFILLDYWGILNLSSN
jgi:hypothetical protein